MAVPAAGTVGSRSYLLPHFPAMSSSGQEAVKQVQIQWKPVLETLVRVLDGVEPVFSHEETSDAMFQMRVSFYLPLDRSNNIFENIIATGNKCSTIWEAESEAAAAALQKLEGGRFGTRIMDISRLRCEELKKRCGQLLGKASELHGGVKLILSDWQENMMRVEACYVKLNNRILEGIRYGAEDILGEIMLDVSECLVKVHKGSEPKHGEMVAESEKLKRLFNNVKERANNHFYRPCINPVGQTTGDFSQELNLSMRIVLQEMMKSIGWPEPCFSVAHKMPVRYVCETCLFPDQSSRADATNTVNIVGPEAPSEDDAVDGSCKATILFLENKFGICLVDVNYNSRGHIESYVSEIECAVQAVSSIGDKILAEWEALVDGIYRCGEYCKGLAAKHPEKKGGDELYHVKRECAIIVDRLEKACRSDLELAKRRLANAGIWTGE